MRRLGIDDRVLDYALSSTVTGEGFTMRFPEGQERIYGVPSPTDLTIQLAGKYASAILLRRPPMAPLAYVRGEVDVFDNETRESGRVIPALKHLGELVMGYDRGLPPALRDFNLYARRLHERFRQDPNDPASHYDRGNKLFGLFLDDSLTYSAAYFGDNPELMTLKEAQRRKRANVLDKVGITAEGEGKYFMEHGIGWGYTIVEGLLRNHNHRAVGTTKSIEQLKAAQQLAEEMGVAVRLTLLLKSAHEVSQMPEFQGVFDAVYSIGMLEHVGRDGHGQYFDDANTVLKEGGVILVHTIADVLDRPPGPFTRLCTFQGGYLPTVSRLIDISSGSGFVGFDLESRKRHYEITSDRWGQQLETNKDTYMELWRKKQIRHHHPEIQTAERGFRFDCIYLAMAAAGFTKYGPLDIVQLVGYKGHATDKSMTRAGWV